MYINKAIFLVLKKKTKKIEKNIYNLLTFINNNKLNLNN